MEAVSELATWVGRTGGIRLSDVWEVAGQLPSFPGSYHLVDEMASGNQKLKAAWSLESTVILMYFISFIRHILMSCKHENPPYLPRPHASFSLEGPIR